MGGWAAAGAAAAGIFGGLLQNRETRVSVARDRDFQKDMRDTAYQAAMADMKIAGLNPILAYKQGPASSPTGRSYQAQNVLGKSANSAVAAYAAASQVKNTQADTELKLQEIRRMRHDTNSAASTARIKNKEAEMAEKYGVSALGRSAGSIERMINNLGDKFRGWSAQSKIKTENLPPPRDKRSLKWGWDDIMQRLRTPSERQRSKFR